MEGPRKNTTPPKVQPRGVSLSKVRGKQILTKKRSLPLPTTQRAIPQPLPRTSRKSESDLSDTIDLKDVIKKYAHLIPICIKVVVGHVAKNDCEPDIKVDDIFTVHAIKKSKVVTIVDSKNQVYNVPLYSAAKFGIVGDVHSDEYVCTYTVSELIATKLRPRVIASLCSYQGQDETMSFRQFEVLVLNDHFDMTQSSQTTTVIGVYSITQSKQKFIPRECDILFSTDPSATQLYLSEILEHHAHLLPCQARLFISQNQAKLPKHLTTHPVTIKKQCTETSLMVSLKERGTPNLSDQAKVYLDIPATTELGVQITSHDAVTTIQDLDQKDVQKYLNASSNSELTTQSLFLKVLRSGYETLGTKITTARISRSDDTGPDNIYDDVVTNKSSISEREAQKVKQLNSNEAAPPTVRTHKKVGFNPIAQVFTPTSKKREPVSLLRVSTRTNQAKGPPTSEKPSRHSQESTEVNQSNSSKRCPITLNAPSSQQQNVATLPCLPQLTKKLREHPKIFSDQQRDLSMPQMVHGSDTATKQTGSTTDKTELAQSATRKRIASQDQAPTPSTSLSSTSLETINNTLQLLLEKVTKLEENQTQFDKRLTKLEAAVSGKNKPKVNCKKIMNVSAMTQLDVQNLLDAMNMSQYKESFSREWVDGEVFKELDEESLAELGVMSKLQRLKLIKVISSGLVEY